ncbi:hypothetical protein [Glutamicibacter sp.]|jgi:hypothetical protein|uniref:hypothetical protein n=1 Tax=Glutamicibacter sp. TaxID=1931995 RepID=UPI002B46939A|nr:hypothetical protein [Glutamicibacter sp.]HJX79183.1 hypothetical protein [Glutamicibacter sp.]
MTSNKIDECIKYAREFEIIPKDFIISNNAYSILVKRFPNLDIEETGDIIKEVFGFLAGYRMGLSEK